MPNDKSEQLILYICAKLKDEKGFGSTVLNKTLYFIDNIYYALTGKPISDFSYIKQNYGPTPKPSQFLPLLERMCKDGKLALTPVDFFGHIQKKPVALVDAQIDCFTKEELVFIDSIIDAFKESNATLASRMSHELIAWEIAQPMEELPLYTSLISEDILTEGDMEWAKECGRKYGHLADSQET